MKKMVLITTKNEVSVLDYPVGKPGDWKEEMRGFYKAISCDCVECVHPRYMYDILQNSEGLVMVVDEEGLIAGKQINLVASIFYGTPVHGQPIVGDVLILAEEMTFDGTVFVGLDEERAEQIAESVKSMFIKYGYGGSDGKQ